jgi:hypothetical protein
VELAEGLHFGLKDNDIFGNARLFAMQQYRDFLNREGDPGGISFWTDQVASGATSRAQCIENFFNSAEFQSGAAPIVRLYFAFFNRIPDFGGLMYWIGNLRSGFYSLDQIASSFAGSAEFQGTYGSLTNAQFVDLIYHNLLGREPDSGGFAFWTHQLDSGQMSRGQVMRNFSESSEYQSLSFSKVYVTMAYVGMLRRAPDQGGFDFWVGYMNTNSGLALINGFLASTEYHNRFLP